MLLPYGQLREQVVEGELLDVEREPDLSEVSLEGADHLRPGPRRPIGSEGQHAGAGRGVAEAVAVAIVRRLAHLGFRRLEVASVAGRRVRVVVVVEKGLP